MIRAALALMLLLVAASPARDVNSVRQALEARYQHARTLRAAFFERYTDGNGGESAESGTVYFSRPGRMRWEYESPEQKLFLLDGKNVWFYVPADHTASRAKMKESSDWRTPIALLAGKADLGKLCRSLEVLDASAAKPNEKPNEKPLSPADSVLRCMPRDATGAMGEQIRDVVLEMDPEAHLVRVLIHEPGNLETEFRFGNWQENIPIPEDKFHFSPPQGGAVVDEDKLGDETR